MPFKVLSTSPTFGHFAEEPVKYLKEHGFTVELVPQGRKVSEEDLMQILPEFDAVIVGVEKMTEPVLQASKKLKIITKHGAGIDNIDVKAASNKGILVTYATGTNSGAVADLTIGLFLSLARSLPFADRSAKEGRWPRIVGAQVNGKVLGIIGLGQIGKSVARRAHGFDMKVIAYDIFKDEAFAQEWGIVYLSLEKVLAQSDFTIFRRSISIHSIAIQLR